VASSRRRNHPPYSNRSRVICPAKSMGVPELLRFLRPVNKGLASPVSLSQNEAMKKASSRPIVLRLRAGIDRRPESRHATHGVEESRMHEDCHRQGISGATVNRPALLRCLKTLKAGDTLTVWKLDRLGRSLRDLIKMLDDLKAHGVKFHSLTEAIDTTTPTGRAMWQMIGILAELERSLIGLNPTLTLVANSSGGNGLRLQSGKTGTASLGARC
jgi:hypothetical protein